MFNVFFLNHTHTHTNEHNVYESINPSVRNVYTEEIDERVRVNVETITRPLSMGNGCDEVVVWCGNETETEGTDSPRTNTTHSENTE